MLIRKKILICFMSICYVCMSIAHAEQATQSAPTRNDVKDFIVSVSNKVIETLKQSEGNTQLRQDFFEQIFRDVGDVPRIARFVAAYAWRSADKAIQDKYVEIYRKYMAFTYAMRITKYSTQKLTVKRISDVNARNIIVSSTLNSQTKDGLNMQIEWQIRSDADTLKVIDLKIENISMALTQRAEFTNYLKNNGNDLSALTKFLEKRLPKNNL